MILTDDERDARHDDDERPDEYDAEDERAMARWADDGGPVQ